MTEFSIGGVIGDTIRNLASRFPLHFAYAFVPAAVSAGLSILVNSQVLSASSASAMPSLSPLYWLNMLAGIGLTGWSMTGITGSMLRGTNGDLSVADIIQISLANIGRYMVLYLIWYLGLILGMALLIIPGLIILSMFAASIPAMIDKDLGPWEALQESRRLSKGRRLSILVTLILLSLVAIIPSFATLSMVGFDASAILRLSQAGPSMFSAFTVLTGSLMSVLLSAYFVALYGRLSDGVRPELIEAFS